MRLTSCIEGTEACFIVLFVVSFVELNGVRNVFQSETAVTFMPSMEGDGRRFHAVTFLKYNFFTHSYARE